MHTNGPPPALDNPLPLPGATGQQNGPFPALPDKLSFPQLEASIRSFWKTHNIYARSLEQRRNAPPFVFYEGPPTANGLPHPGHCLTRVVKDLFPRYKTMTGHYCQRKAGWDTHGLPVEVEVCKELGIADGGRAAIERMGVAEFNHACLQSVFRYTREWEQLTERLGFWVDLDDAYVTYHKPYVESVWWALKQLFDAGLLYQGYKVVWWWPQGGTALSSGEVAEGYKDVVDPAVTVRFALLPEATAALIRELKQVCHLPHQPDISLLAWTTTPWTLHANVALAVGADITYALVQEPPPRQDPAQTAHSAQTAQPVQPDPAQRYALLAESLIEAQFGQPATPLALFTGRQLAELNLRYQPLFDYARPEPLADAPEAGPAPHAGLRHHEVVCADFVTTDTGTGIVHIAPAFGEDDFRLARQAGLGLICLVRPDGSFDDRVTDRSPIDQSLIAGMHVKAADRHIVKLLEARGAIFRRDQYKHPYPFCPRAENDPLIQYARKSWFIRTASLRDDMLANNAQISWQPEHIRDGRFGKFLENNVDWALSRERFWGTPLPIWVCSQTGRAEALASYDELLAKPGLQGLDAWLNAKAHNPGLPDDLRVHKPYIDAITYNSPFAPSARMHRVPDVIDVWFDAGSMPFAQWHYPHKPDSAQRFRQSLPADFISEALDQTRGWFYVMLAISTLLSHAQQRLGAVPGSDLAIHRDATPPHPYKNVICLGLLLGEDGLKLSKRRRNYKEPTYLFDQYGADALRWSLIAANPPTASIRFAEAAVQDAAREFLIRWYNVLSFFTIYANIDNWNPDSAQPAQPTELDHWILAELNSTTAAIRADLDSFKPYEAAQHLHRFLDALSNWYLRRSRSRFWATGLNPDKAAAYTTLYTCLTSLARLAAPFVPFFAEFTWQQLVVRNQPAAPPAAAPPSVHLADYPLAEPRLHNPDLQRSMAAVRLCVRLGLSVRAASRIKVRQPLSSLRVAVTDPDLRSALSTHAELIAEELNVKQLDVLTNADDYVHYNIVPNFKLLGPKLGPRMPRVKPALAAADAASLYQQSLTGPICLDLNDNLPPVTLTPDEIEVRLSARDGYAAAADGGLVVVLTTDITPELRAEGTARDLIRAIQELRKELNLPYEQRIGIALHTTDDQLAQAITTHRPLIAGEVLANQLTLSDPPPSQPQTTTRTIELDGQALQVHLWPA